MNKMETFRTTARVVGIVYIAGMVIGIGGNILIQSILGTPDYLSTISSNSMKLVIGAMLWLMTVGGDTAHGVLMFPVLRQHNEGIAIGYLGFRIIDAIFIGIHVLFVLIQIPIGSEYMKAEFQNTIYLQSLSTVFIMVNQYGYQIGMIFVGLAGLILCNSFYRSKLVPKFVALWGLVGYAAILCGSILEVMGFDMHLIHTIPGGLWELFTGVWLIVKGFNSSPTALTSVKTGINEG
jgi:hypothetical protein